MIELLVVVTIISILAALLLPSLKRAKESANSAVCINNLRQIYTGTMLYINDNDGFFPPIDSGGRNYWWRKLGGGPFASSQSYVGPPGPLFGPYKSPISFPWASTYRRWPVFRCPGEKGYMVQPGAFDAADPAKWCTMYDLDLDNCSYDINYSVNYSATQPPNRTRNISQPVDYAGGPAAAWLFVDCQAYTSVDWYINETSLIDISNPGDARDYAFRHPGHRANAVFLDGHCGTLQPWWTKGAWVAANWVYVKIWDTAPY